MFRWIAYTENKAAFNMAVDEAILEAHRQGLTPPTLRFYGWSPPAVSAGYAQKMPAETRERIRSNGYSLVRRATGGRAVLHDGDLTYSFIGSSRVTSAGSSAVLAISPDHLASSVSQSYFQICQGLLAGLKNLGIEAELGRGKSYAGFQDCFLSTTNADLQVDGLKLIGSAQLRRQHAVLQHGSILLNQQQNALPDLLQPQSVMSTPRHKNLFELTGVLPIATIERAFVQGFAAAFGEVLEPGELTEYELEVARSLEEKFAFSQGELTQSSLI